MSKSGFTDRQKNPTAQRDEALSRIVLHDARTPEAKAAARELESRLKHARTTIDRLNENAGSHIGTHPRLQRARADLHHMAHFGVRRPAEDIRIDTGGPASKAPSHHPEAMRIHKKLWADDERDAIRLEATLNRLDNDSQTSAA